MTIEIRTIEVKRVRLAVTKSDLCRRAGVAETTYRDLLSGKYRGREATLAKLNTVLNKVAAGTGDGSATNPHDPAYRAVLALVAVKKDLDPNRVLEADPALRATNNAEWRAAAECRRIAFHVCNGAFGFRNADIARAAGVTKAAVSLAVREIEEARDRDAGLDAILDELTYLLS